MGSVASSIITPTIQQKVNSVPSKITDPNAIVANATRKTITSNPTVARTGYIGTGRQME